MAEFFLIGHKQMHNGTDRVMHHSLSNLIIRDYLKDSTFIRPTERWTLMKIVDKVAYPGADPGNYGWGGRVCVNKGKALDRGTKCRAGGGYGRGVSPLPIWKKIKIRDCLDVF